jgi:predicted unusual protein kinase regulating ubiquinone biosynthesis (AarF/ABC1/UbiB family)
VSSKKDRFKTLVRGKSEGNQSNTAVSALLQENIDGTKNTNVNASENTSVNVEVSESVVKSLNEGLTRTKVENEDYSEINLLDIANKVAKERKKKKKFEDQHSKQTYWIRNDVLEALNKIARERGEKTRIINNALIDYIKKLG